MEEREGGEVARMEPAGTSREGKYNDILPLLPDDGGELLLTREVRCHSPHRR